MIHGLDLRTDRLIILIALWNLALASGLYLAGRTGFGIACGAMLLMLSASLLAKGRFSLERLLRKSMVEGDARALWRTRYKFHALAIGMMGTVSLVGSFLSAR